MAPAVAVSKPRPPAAGAAVMKRMRRAAHPVVAEALPHLGEEERREPARMAEEAVSEGPLPGELRQRVPSSHSPRSKNILVHRMGRCGLCWSPPTTSAVSRSAWPRPRPGCGAPGSRSTCVDTSRGAARATSRFAAASLVAFYLPMHTATRLAAPLIDACARVNPAARLCAYGLYAPLNARVAARAGRDAGARAGGRSRSWST